MAAIGTIIEKPLVQQHGDRRHSGWRGTHDKYFGHARVPTDVG